MSPCSRETLFNVESISAKLILLRDFLAGGGRLMRKHEYYDEFGPFTITKIGVNTRVGSSTLHNSLRVCKKCIGKCVCQDDLHEEPSELGHFLLR